MFGSVRTVFTSRWKALWWACGVLLTAYCSVPSPEQDPVAKAHAEHVNPWAKGYHAQAAVQEKSSVDSLRDMLDEARKAEQEQQAREENPWAKKPEQKNS